MEITQGKVTSAQKVLVYGPEGIGKSTFAAKFPRALFIDVEGSTKHLDVRRLPTPESWTMLLEEVRYVITEPGVCQTLVIDTADWAEQLCIHHVCAVAQKGGIEDFGYGKGYTYLAEEFGKLLNHLSDVIEHDIHVVLTAHAQIRKFEQPDEMAAYDRWELKLGKKTAPLVKEWCDMVLFANYKTFAVKDSKTQKVTGQGGKRVLFTSHSPAFDAKNRHELEPELELDYKSIGAVIPAMDAKPAPKKFAAKKAAPEPALEPDATEPEDAPASEKTVEELPHYLLPLFQLMSKAGVTEDDVRAVVADRGYFPLNTPMKKYPADFVDGVLIGAWPKVLEAIEKTHQDAIEAVPFK